MKFVDLKLSEPILQVLHAEKYETPTPIQARAIPPILEGKDLLGCAQTGTGKTAAFSLPMLQRIMCDSPHAHDKKRHIRALVLSPTRELASQIGQSIRTYGGKTGVRYAVIFGGVGQGAQVEALRSGIDILVATPGRLLDLMNQRHVDLKHIEFFVLDEADRMLDMGFVHDIRRVIQHLPPKRQNLMFSATMPPEIRKLADSFLHHPVSIEIAPVSSTVDLIEQFVYHVRRDSKAQLLAHLFENAPMSRVIVFTRTKHGADRVVRRMRTFDIHAEAIHGDKAQNARQRALQNFKVGKTPMLVATDIAARGIDVDNISHVVNYDIPNEPETYVHRIGRTGRAGATGVAFSFCDEAEERQYLRQIERLIRKQIEVKTDAPAFQAPAPSAQSHQPRPSHDRRHHEHPRREHASRDHGHGEHRRSEHRGEHRSEHRSEHRVEHRGDHRGNFSRDGDRREHFNRERAHRDERRPQHSHSADSHQKHARPGQHEGRPARASHHASPYQRPPHRGPAGSMKPQMNPNARPPGDTTRGHNPSPKRPHRKGMGTHKKHPLAGE